MTQKTKTILGIAVLAAVIGVSTLAYKALEKNYALPSSIDIAAENQDGDGSAVAPEKVLAPDFGVLDGEGNTVKLSDFAGKPVVINYWASWCSPCKKEMPEFDKVWKELGEEVVFLMVNATDGKRETEKIAKEYIANKGFSFPVYYDTTQELGATYGLGSLPTTLFIDKDGYLVTGAKGMLDEETLRKGIELIRSEEGAQTDAAGGETAADRSAVPPVYNKITAEEAHERMSAGDGEQIILDVRTEEEYAAGHIEGAVLIPDTEIEARAAAELPDSTADIFVYCRSGRRSETAAKKLVELGYNHVYDFGGINDWPYDTVS